jgi:hypothetical protein
MQNKYQNSANEQMGILTSGVARFFICSGMGSKFTIFFSYLDFLFIGEVRKQMLERRPVYQIFYALAANPEAVEQMEIYQGSAPDHAVYWRQRIKSMETGLADPQLVETIGRAIRIQEDIEST